MWEENRCPSSFEARQPGELEQPLDALLPLLAPHLENVGEKGQVLQHRQVAVERELLRHVADALFDLLRLLLGIEPRHVSAAFSGVHDRAQHADRRRLARPIRPQQAKDLALVDTQIESIHSNDLFKLLCQVLSFDDKVVFIHWTYPCLSCFTPMSS